MAETAKIEKFSCSVTKKNNYLEELLTMKSMKGMKFKTRRKAVFFLDFMIFMPFMVKCFRGYALDSTWPQVCQD